MFRVLGGALCLRDVAGADAVRSVALRVPLASRALACAVRECGQEGLCALCPLLQPGQEDILSGVPRVWVGRSPEGSACAARSGKRSGRGVFAGVVLSTVMGDSDAGRCVRARMSMSASKNS